MYKIKRFSKESDDTKATILSVGSVVPAAGSVKYIKDSVKQAKNAKKIFEASKVAHDFSVASRHAADVVAKNRNMKINDPMYLKWIQDSNKERKVAAELLDAAKTAKKNSRRSAVIASGLALGSVGMMAGANYYNKKSKK